MPTRVYISCDFSERELIEIKEVCNFLITRNCQMEFAPKDCYWTYQNIEEAIERCDIFIAGVGLSYSCSTWLAHEITYAFALSRNRLAKRPKIFAVRLSNYDKPTFIETFSDNYPVTWLQKNNYSSLFED
jgi:hypothetical protein